jgi:hypothetical protein
MTTKVKKHLDFLRLLCSSHIKQRRQLINTVSEEQLSVLTEAVYNVLKGVCPLSNADKNKLSKNKTLLRKFSDPKLSKRLKITILKKIQNLMPELLRPVIRYITHDGEGSSNGSKGEIQKTNRKLQKGDESC